MIKSTFKDFIPLEFQVHVACLHIKQKVGAHQFSEVQESFRFYWVSDAGDAAHGPISQRVCVIVTAMSQSDLQAACDTVVEALWANPTLPLFSEPDNVAKAHPSGELAGSSLGNSEQLVEHEHVFSDFCLKNLYWKITKENKFGTIFL